MTTQLPAHLQGRNVRKITAEAANEGLGSSLPPHISIRGNSFTLIDSAGNEAGPPVAALQAAIFDMSDHINKRYYADAWTPDSGEPPTCWSANGLTPSREAMTPQAVLCANCQWNVRGSAVSKLSGVAIKACRDEKWLALYVPNYTNMLFQLVLPPGSFKNWKAFTKPFEGQDTAISDVLLAIGFEPGVNGVLTFGATAYIDAATADLRDKAIQSKVTDVLVGRNDQPRALPGVNGGQPAITSQPTPFVPGTAPNAGFQPTQTAPQLPSGQPVQGASLSNPAPAGQGGSPTRRKRRTAAEMAAAGGSLANAAETRQAPFPNSGSPPTSGPQFGVGPGVPPNPELQQALAGIFNRPQG